jgi:hypothetical protein
MGFFSDLWSKVTGGAATETADNSAASSTTPAPEHMPASENMGMEEPSPEEAKEQLQAEMAGTGNAQAADMSDGAGENATDTTKQ